MFIQSLTLRGIKSYRQENTITFKEGINFIAGKNGAGKTTIIESIGYLLFWIRPYHYKELLSTGAKEGYMSITFVANDERTYSIRREIRKDKCKYVQLEDMQTGQVLEGEDVVREKMCSIHGIYSLEHLEELFQEIVAVSQGKFTAPFLENGMEKKRKFERMFGLETYEEAYKLSSTFPSLIKEQIGSLNEEIADLSGRLSTREEELEKKKNLLEKREVLNGALQKQKEEICLQETLFTKEKEKKVQLDAQREKLEHLRNEYKLLIKEKEHLESSLKEAEAAEKLCLMHKDAHLAYLQHEKEKNALLDSLETLRKIEETDLQLQAKETGIQSTRALLSTQIEELENELHKQQQEAPRSPRKHEIPEAELRLQEIASQLLHIQEESKRSAILKEDLLLLSTYESTMQEAQMQREHIMKELQSLGTIKDAQAQLTQKKEHLQDMEKRYNELTTLLHINAAELEKCKLDSTSCETGCPTCGSTGDFSQHFKEKIDQLQKKSLSYKEEQHTLQEKLKEKTQLQEEETRLTLLKEQELRLHIQLKEVEKKLLEKPEYSQVFKEITPEISTSTVLEALLTKRIALEQEQTQALRTKEKETLLFLEGQKKEQEFFEKQEKFRKEKETLLTQKKQEVNTQLKLLEDVQKERTALQEQLLASAHKRKELTLHTNEMKRTQEAHRIFLAQEQAAQKHPTLQEQIRSKEALLEAQRSLGEEKRVHVAQLEQEFSLDSYMLLEQKLTESMAEVRVRENDMQHLTLELEHLEKKLLQFVALEKTKEEKKIAKEKKEKQLRRLECVRSIFNTAAEPISARFRSLLSEKAALFFRRLSPEPSMLSWGEQFEVFLTKDKDHIRRFQQLSGGEQMIAALAIRLALMRYVSPFSIGFFDEPTQNLDETHRRNLASLLPHVLDGFTQLFLISHDDTFDSLTEHVIVLEKTSEGTCVMG